MLPPVDLAALDGEGQVMEHPPRGGGGGGEQGRVAGPKQPQSQC